LSSSNEEGIGKRSSLVPRPFPWEKGVVCSNCACADFSQLFGLQYIFSALAEKLHHVWGGVYWSDGVIVAVLSHAFSGAIVFSLAQ